VPLVLLWFRFMDFSTPVTCYSIRTSTAVVRRCSSA
jgi:hypothetical protein